MNSQRSNSGSAAKQVQGPRPSPLKIYRDSHRIRKPASVVRPVSSMPIINRSQPTIIHMQVPEIIHAEAQDFMRLVQHLTGSSSYNRNGDPSENLAADDHGSALHKGSAHQPAGSLETMGMCYTDNIVNPSSLWRGKTDRNQEIGSRASEREGDENGLSAVTSVSTVATTSLFSPLSPNFLFPSPRLHFSPSVLKDLSLMTPNSDQSLYSFMDFYQNSEPLLSPSQGPPFNSSSIIG